MTSASFDRWLYLRMHRSRRMGVEEQAILQKLIQPGMTVLDVGGNLGLYTILISRLVGGTGRVVSFEPDPDLFALLQTNTALNGCTNVGAHNLALGRKRDRLVLRKMILNSGDNTLASGGTGRFRREVEIEVVGADEFLPALRPDFIKIDVQGWELEVLIGMDRMLASNPNCQVLLEFWPAGCRRAGYEPAALFDFFGQRGYSLCRPGETEPLSNDALAALTADCSGLKHADLIARRRSR